ncbi:hypothetical protein F441_18520 [Phytophthora nicotianae CJ01A1]|uniref:Uncharacterized protein n=1 Tax=Phytophthora nicotianae CJ01A1 TaxID=1317063 RepID=W2W2K4_PHYNI|nr:hypothetical protein F441_18520 [Phytophthora nicotianae CJ01A1]
MPDEDPHSEYNDHIIIVSRQQEWLASEQERIVLAKCHVKLVSTKKPL